MNYKAKYEELAVLNAQLIAIDGPLPEGWVPEVSLAEALPVDTEEDLWRTRYVFAREAMLFLMARTRGRRKLR